FTVTGTGTTQGSGGTIQSKTGGDGATTTGIGMYFEGTSNISLTNMNFAGTIQNFAIRGHTVQNFTLADANTSGSLGTSNAADEGAISFDELTGTALFEGFNLQGGFEDQ